MTALAAVMALSSTSAFSQSTDVPADPTATPVVDPAPTPAAADPLAPSTPTVAAPAATKSTSTTAARKTTTSRASVTRTRPAPVRTASVVRTAPATPVAPVPEVQPLPAAPVAAAPPSAVPAAPAPASASTIDLLPTAGLGGLGFLLLGGGALAIRSRRRRRAQEAEEAEWQEMAAAEPEAVPEPAMAVEPERRPIPAMRSAAEPRSATGTRFIGPMTPLPAGFDLSRFGPNVQDAYRGPTEDNPSASLKHRLSRAHGMDQQERKLAAEVEAATGQPIIAEADKTAATSPAGKSVGADHADGDFMFKRDEKKLTTRPAYTH